MRERSDHSFVDVPYQSIFIIGAGAWGTALANVAARAGRDVVLCAHREQTASSINECHENKHYLPDVPLVESIRATTDLSEAKNADCILLVTPAQHLRKTLRALPKDDIGKDVPFVLCSKGIETETGNLLGTVFEDEMGQRCFSVLSGPSFASETSKGDPTAVTIACKDKEVARGLANSLSVLTFRPYITDDVVGAQICGAVKNVIAIACGIMHGRDMGDNARAALVTRGLQEIWSLGSAMGTQRKTFMGMSGMGDLMLTSSSMQSRNFSLGVMLGQGRKLEDILKSRSSVTEGVHTADAVLKLARKHAVDLPICRAVYGVLHEEQSVDDTIEALLARPLRDED